MGLLDDYDKIKQGEKDNQEPNAGLLQRAGDLGIDALKGAIALPEAFVGIADIATGGRTGKFLEETVGYEPAKAKEILSDFYSEERKQEQEHVSGAFDEGFFTGLGKAVTEPSVAVGGIVESFPTMLAGGFGAGALIRAFPKIPGYIAAGIGEGVLGAGMAAESIRNEAEDRLLTGEQQLLALGSGVGTALFGMAGSKVAGKFGLEDIDLIRGTKAKPATVSKSVTRRMLEGVLSEGVLEELPQSTQEAIMQNLATGKEWNEGLSEAAGMGLVSGGIMGGSMGIKTQVSHKAVLARNAAVKQLQDQATEEVSRIETEATVSAAAGLADGSAPTSLIDDAETLDQQTNEQRTQEAVAEVNTKTTVATEKITNETEAELLRVVADKIVSGERNFTPEELQVQSNYPDQLEADLNTRRETTMAREDLHQHEKEASVALDADPSLFRKIYAMAKTAKGFSAELVRRFGKGAKKYADRLWGLFKNSKLFTDETGAVGIDINANRQLSMQPDNVSQIKAGTKTATTRSYQLKAGKHVLPDGTAIIVEADTRPISFSEMSDPEAYARAEGFKSLDDMKKNAKFQSTKDFIAGKKKLHVARISLAEPASVISAPEVKLSAEELSLQADEALDPTRTDADVKELHAARAEQLKKEDRPGYEPETIRDQVVPEGFEFSPEDEGFEGDAPFERRARREMSDQELMDRDIAREGLPTEYDRFGYVRDRAMLREQKAGNKVLTVEEMDTIDAEMAVANDKAVDGALKELNNNPEFTISDDFMDPKSGEFGASLADIIASDLHSLGGDLLIEDAINFIKREEARMLGKADESGRTKPLTSLSELQGYPESLSELISHVDSVQAAEDYEYRESIEENYEKEVFLQKISEQFSDDEVKRNSRAIDLMATKPDAIIDFVESEVLASWDLRPGEMKRLAAAFEDEFNTKITNRMLEHMINSVRYGEIMPVEVETDEYRSMADLDLLTALKKHMDKIDVTKLVVKEISRRETQDRKAMEQKKIENQYKRFQESASEKSQINRGTWVAFYRSMAELAGRGIGFQKNKLNINNLVPMVSQKAGGAFAALDPAVQRRLVIEMLQNSFIEDGVFTHKFYSDEVVQNEPMFKVEYTNRKGLQEKVVDKERLDYLVNEYADIKIEELNTQYSSEAFDAQYEATQLGEIVDTDFVDKSELRKAKQKTFNIKENKILFEVKYKTDKGKNIKAVVDASRLETILDENESVNFSQIEGKHDVVENWSWASDVEKILNFATNSSLMSTAATMNKMDEDAYLDMIDELYQKVYQEKDNDDKSKREIDRQLRLISALAAEQQYTNKALYDDVGVSRNINDPQFFEKLSTAHPELGRTGAELYDEFLKSGGDGMIFNSRINRQVNPKYTEEQKKLTSTPMTVEDVFQETTFNEKSDYELGFLGEAHRRIGPQPEGKDSYQIAKTGRLNNKIAQTFYTLVAKTFGADLVIISDDNYPSRYIGEASDGRSKIIINMKGSNHFAGIFAHELFHHVVNKAAPDQYAAFKSNIKDMVSADKYEAAIQKEMALRDISHELAEEEVLADLFKNVVSQSAFYERLALTKPGEALASKLVARLIRNISKVPGIINRDQGGWWHKNENLLNHADMIPLYNLFSSLVTETKREFPPRHTEERYLSPIGEATVTELKGYLDAPTGWLQGAWKRVFKPGTKNHRDMMKNIQGIIEDTLQFIKKMKPNAVFADFLADPIQTAIMNKLVYDAGWEVKKIRKQVTDKHKKTFEDMTSAELEQVHDVFVRSPQEGSEEAQADINLIQKKIDAINKTYPGDKPANVQTELDRITSEKAGLESSIVNGIDVGTKKTPNTAGVAKAEELGFSKEVIEAFQDYKAISQAMYGKLKEVYPDLKYRETHYGQSIRWRRQGAPQHDDEFDFVLDPTKSKLKGSEHFLEEKSTEETAKIRERGFVYDTIDPGELLLGYVREAEKTLALHTALKTAGTTLDSEGKPILRVFENEYDAMKAGYGKSSDAALNVYEELDLDIGYKVFVDGNPYTEDGSAVIFASEENANEKAATITIGKTSVQKIEIGKIQKTAGYEVVHTKSGTVIAHHVKPEDAYDQVTMLQKGGQEFSVKPVQGTAKNAQVAQLYLSKDMARMMNNYLSKDRIRSTKIGESLMNVKNHMTSLEFAFSVFHALTIGQELAASYGAWAISRARRGEKKFGMTRALAESKEIVLLAEKAIEDPEIMKDPAFQKKVDELLGTSGLDIMDIAKQYALVGGRLHQDASLRSSAFKLGEAKYRTVERGVEIVDGEVVFTGRRGNKGPADTVKAMKDSIKNVFDKQMKENPDKRVQALAKSLQFGVFQTTSAWLMEEAIPEIKMAMWMREYTLRVEKQAEEIASGQVLKEEIAHNVMKFIEDRFGEVNWQNQWMDPTAKTFLQFAFRSFTWFTGSWKALTKAGVDVGKLGWFTVQDIGAKEGDKVNYKLTEKGQWGFAALFTHIATVMMVKALYIAVLAGSGSDEVPTDEETPLLTELLFPRVDFNDPRARVTIPSYISEGYKIMRHLGVIGDEAEYSKLISGRTSSIIGNSIEALYAGEDWRGVSIRDPKDNVLVQGYDTLAHIFISPPISFSSFSKTLSAKGADPTMALSFLGITDAPAAAKRSGATNKAFDLAREEFKGTSITEDEIELKDDVRRAMYKYSQGDKTEINQMRKDGLLSDRQFKNALSKIAMINGKKNPSFKPELERALKRLTIDSAVEVWSHMTAGEKKKYKAQIIQKYRNMVVRRDRSRKQKKEIREAMKEAGIFK